MRPVSKITFQGTVMSSVSWKLLSEKHKLGIETHGGVPVWVSLTEDIARTVVGLTAPGLKILSTNKNVVEADYDKFHKSTDSKLHPVTLKPHHKGPAQLQVMENNTVVARLDVRVFPLRPVRLAVRNVVSI